MKDEFRRREFLGLMGVSGVTFASALWGCGGTNANSATVRSGRGPGDDFFFLQLSDTHWGYRGPANPESAFTLKDTIARIRESIGNGLVPDFVVFTGDLTHTTDDARERRARLAQFKELVAPLGTKTLFLPGEHDAAPDRGEAYREAFGGVPYAFDHKGIHFIALDNASAPGGALGEAQLAWLEGDLAQVPHGIPIVVFAHRPLFDLAPEWEWATKDGSSAIELLSRRENVTVFYGHIHQEHHLVTRNVKHHASRSLVFPLPAPGSAPKRAPMPWDPNVKDHGLGYRRIDRALRIEEVHATSTSTSTSTSTATATPTSTSTATPTYDADVKAALERNCFSCHSNDGIAAADHDWSKPEVAFAQRNRIKDAITSGAMPPRGRPPLTDVDRDILLRWIANAK